MSNKYDEVDKFRDSLSRGAAEPRAEFLSQLKAEFISRAERTSRLNNFYTAMRNSFINPHIFLGGGLAVIAAIGAVVFNVVKPDVPREVDDSVIAKIVEANPNYSANPNEVPNITLLANQDGLTGGAGKYYERKLTKTFFPAYDNCGDAQRQERYLLRTPGEKNEQTLNLLLTGDGKSYSKSVAKSDGEVIEIIITTPDEEYTFFGGEYAIVQKSNSIYGDAPDAPNTDDLKAYLEESLPGAKIVKLVDGREVYEFKFSNGYSVECAEFELNAGGAQWFDATTYEYVGTEIFVNDGESKKPLWQEFTEEKYSALSEGELKSKVSEMSYTNLPYAIQEQESSNLMVNTSRKAEANAWLSQNAPLLIVEGDDKLDELYISDVSKSLPSKYNVREFYPNTEYGKFLFDFSQNNEQLAGDGSFRAGWSTNSQTGGYTGYNMLNKISDFKLWLQDNSGTIDHTLSEVNIMVAGEQVSGMQSVFTVSDETKQYTAVFDYKGKSYAIYGSNDLDGKVLTVVSAL